MDRKSDRIYFKTNKERKKVLRVLLAIVLIYIFFFTSSYTLPSRISENVTALGEPLSYSQGRSVTVYEATYDKKSKQLEIVMSLDNSADSVNEYLFFGFPEGKRNYTGVEMETVYNDILITVLRFNNLKSFDEMSLIFAPKIAEDPADIPDSYVGSLVFNKNNLTYAELSDRSREEYILVRLEGTIANLEAELASAEEDKALFTTENENYKKEIDELTDNMEFLTSSEKAAAEERIGSCESDIDKNKRLIAQKEEEIEELQKDLQEAEEMLESFGGKK